MEDQSTKNVAFFRFEDLRVYHRSLDYIDWVYSSTGLFPDEKAGEKRCPFGPVEAENTLCQAHLD